MDDSDELEEFLDLFRQVSPPTSILPEISTEDPLETFLPEPPPAVVECAVPTSDIGESDLSVHDPLEGVVAHKELLLGSARRLLTQGPFSLVGLVDRPFSGDGVSVLYYHGDLQLYAPIRSPGATCPIYIGKSAQPGRHQGSTTHLNGACNMHHRLTVEHCRSIEQAQLGLENFTFRFLLLPPMWVDFVEQSLIELFHPLWNVVRGFGSRSCRTRKCELFTASAWDTLHPGRKGAGIQVRSLEDTERVVLETLPSCVRTYQAAMQQIEEHPHSPTMGVKGSMERALSTRPVVFRT